MEKVTRIEVVTMHPDGTITRTVKTVTTKSKKPRQSTRTKQLFRRRAATREEAWLASVFEGIPYVDPFARPD